MDLMNKVVKVPSVEFLEFFYPKLYRVDSFMPMDNCLYTGPAQHIVQFRKAGYNFIAINGMPEYDLTDREQLLRFVYDKFKKEPPKYLLEVAALYDTEIFYKYIKETWVTGRWPEKIDESDVTIFNLYQSFNRGSAEMYKTLFTLLENNKPQVIMSSVLTFLERVKAVDEQSVSVTYAQVIRQFRDSLSKNIVPAINRYINTKTENSELNLVMFLSDLTTRR